MSDEETYKHWEEIGRKIDSKLYPYRWYLLVGGAVLGLLAAIYF